MWVACTVSLRYDDGECEEERIERNVEEKGNNKVLLDLRVRLQEGRSGLVDNDEDDDDD